MSLRHLNPASGRLLQLRDGVVAGHDLVLETLLLGDRVVLRGYGVTLLAESLVLLVDQAGLAGATAHDLAVRLGVLDAAVEAFTTVGKELGVIN